MYGSLAIKRITLKSSAMAAPPPPAPEPATATKPGAKSTRQSSAAKDAKATKEPQIAAVPELQFIQDSRENLNVRVDLGGVVPAGKPVTLVFEYEGALESAQGGPLQNSRLAFVGEQGSYLFYAARWFPFHDYAVDRATYQINVTVPKGVTAVGYSDQSVIPVSTTDAKTKTEFSDGVSSTRPR